MPAGAPAAEWLGETRLPSLVTLGERTDEHHPAPPQTLFRGRQTSFHGSGDLRRGPADDVVEDHRYAVDHGQAGQGVLQLIAKLGPLQDPVGRDRVAIVAPVGLDGVDVELVATDGYMGSDVSRSATRPSAWLGSS